MHFKDINKALDFVCERRKDKASFEKFSDLLSSYGNPQDDFKTIHVAGTNGKGSTVSYLRDLLLANGYTVGTMQSPHYKDHFDRIRVNGIPIEQDEFLNLLNKHLDLIKKNNLSMFQIDYLISLDYFRQKKVDFVISEVGMGGRLDATNVISKPVLSIIVTIGFDHMAELGSTIEEIAKEKAGIIKEDCPCLVGNLPSKAEKVIEEIVINRNSQLYKLDKAIDLNEHGFLYRNKLYKLSSLAKYQIHNASLAIEAYLILEKQYHLRNDDKLSYEAIYRSNWPGRFEIIDHAPLLIIDGAHNEEGIRALNESLDKIPLKKAIIFSALNNKEYDKMIETLQKQNNVFLCKFNHPQLFNIEEIAIKHKLSYYDNVIELYEKLKETYPCIVVCGSLYFISEFNKEFQRRYPLK